MLIVIDMNLSPRWTAFLGGEGFEAQHWSEIGLADALDSVIMDHARATGSVILTHDLDFGAILAASGDVGPSVVQIRAGDLSVTAIGPQIVAALRQAADALAAGALVTVEPDRMRLTMLPIGDQA